MVILRFKTGKKEGSLKQLWHPTLSLQFPIAAQKHKDVRIHIKNSEGQRPISVEML
jgi:hypothetical protein